MSKDDERLVVHGKPSRKIRVHNYHNGTSVAVVAEFDDEEDFLIRYKPHLARDERILVRKRDKPAEYVRVRDYIRVYEVSGRASAGLLLGRWICRSVMSSS